MDTTIEEMLENRHQWSLEWCEPWRALTADRKEIYAHVSSYASIHDCINMQRRNASKSPKTFTDSELLWDFMTVHHTRLATT